MRELSLFDLNSFDETTAVTETKLSVAGPIFPVAETNLSDAKSQALATESNLSADENRTCVADSKPSFAKRKPPVTGTDPSNAETKLSDTSVHQDFDLIPLSIQEQTLHDRAKQQAANYLRNEALLVEAIEQVDRLQLFEKFALTSTFAYCVRELNLSPSVSYHFIAVARAGRKAPALREAVASGAVPVSKAAQVCSVINKDNQDVWVEKAKTETKAELEKDVAQLNPDKTKRASQKPVGENRTRISFDADDAFMKDLKRVQVLESQRTSRTTEMPEAIRQALALYLKAHDPILKAERAELRRKAKQKDEIPKEENQKMECAKKSEKPDQETEGPERSKVQQKTNQKFGSEERIGIRQKAKQKSACVKGDQTTNQNAGFERETNQNTQANSPQGPSTSIPAAVLHQLHLRDQGCCRARLPDGSVCSESRYTHVHHLRRRADGGTHELENLITLCSAHHRQWHEQNDLDL